MSVEIKNFINLCLAGEAEPDEIDDFVERWHDTPQSDVSLSEFLGMTENEYSLWVVDPDHLRVILYARKYNVPLKDAVMSTSDQLAARSESREEAERLKKWLQFKGLI